LNDLAVVFDVGGLRQHVLHEQARAQDAPLQAATLEVLLDLVVRAAVQRLDLRADDLTTARNLDDELRTGGLRGLDDVDLLLGRLRVVARDDEHAFHSG
jgi:hypothetical protein